MTKSASASEATPIKREFTVLLASARSGTNLLKRIVTTDPAITDTSETFRPSRIDEYSAAENFWKFLRDHRPLPTASPLTAQERKVQWRAYLDFLAGKFPGQIKILDFKYNNLRSADAGYLWPEEPPLPLRLAKQDGLPIIRIKRRNHLATLCSAQLADMTDEWVRSIGDMQKTHHTVVANRITLETSSLLGTLKAMKWREKLVDFWVEDHPDRIEFFYEDLLLDGRLASCVTEKIEGFLGRRLNISPEPQTLKISPPLDQLIENYDAVEKLLAGTEYALFLPKMSRKHHSDVVPAQDPQLPTQESHFSAKILASRPLVTLLGISPTLDGLELLSEAAPEVFATRSALHLLHLQGTIEADGAAKFARELARAQGFFPGHVFLPLAASEAETFHLARHGIASLVANGGMFVDEKMWRPQTALIAGIPMFDAIYCARLDPVKRHELGAVLDSLLLTYGPAMSQSQPDAYERVRAILPKAFFANHQLAAGRKLDHGMVCRLYGHACVGLCLSAVEGCMRASMEYLLCGLPVVSTPSTGGRDRYYAGAYCRQIEAAPDAIAAAVRELADKKLDRQKIRNHVAQLVGFDRHNFLLNINKIARHHLGVEDLFPGFAPLAGAVATFSPASQVVANIRREFARMQ